MCKPDKIDMQKILYDISMGYSLRRACEEQKVSPQTFYDKLDEDSSLKEQYTRSREHRGENCISNIEKYKAMLVAKEIDPATARVLIDTEKWEACKFYPKMFGEKQEVELSGKDGGSIQFVIRGLNDKGNTTPTT